MSSTAEAVPVLPDPPEMTSLTLQAFCNDVARQIHSPREIATRYGFSSPKSAKQWIIDRPAVGRAIKELRAIWESEDNLEGRIRAYAQHALLEAAPDNARIMLDPTVHPSVRIDAMKETAKLAGVVGGPGGITRDRNGQVVAADGRFAVNIIFQSTGQVEHISTLAPSGAPDTPDPPVIDGEAA
jgi:hypothetical protein